MKKPGRPKTSDPRSDYLDIRLTSAEKRGFNEAAKLAGVPLATWVRERLRLAAIRELESAGRRAPFIESVPLGGPND